MKKIIYLILFCILIASKSYGADVTTYSEKNKFGLIEGSQKLTEAKYSKLIRLKDSWLFLYKNKYGIMDNKGEIIIEPMYSQAERLAGRFAKLGKKGLYTIIDDKGNKIVGEEYSSIGLLYGKMFLVEKRYKFGLISFEGDIILAPVADDIYMPKPNVLKILYEGVWYEIESTSKEGFLLPKDISEIKQSDKTFKVTSFIQNPITSTGYGIVSASDYFIKLFSSVSPAYEQTIDELILGHGADTATILIKSGWIVKFPFVYGKNYINNLKAPNNGPLSDVKTNLKNKLD